MPSSILNETKHMLGLYPDDTSFDTTLIIHINTALSYLAQIGVGPVEGIMITDATTEWEPLIPSPALNAVKSYVFLRVKTLFDPPSTGFHTTSIENQLREMEYRINVVVDHYA